MARVPLVLSLVLGAEAFAVGASPKWLPAFLRPAEASDQGIWFFALVIPILVLGMIYMFLMRCPYCLEFPVSRKPFTHGEPIVFNVSRCENCQMPLK